MMTICRVLPPSLNYRTSRGISSKRPTSAQWTCRTAQWMTTVLIIIPSPKCSSSSCFTKSYDFLNKEIKSDLRMTKGSCVRSFILLNHCSLKCKRRMFVLSSPDKRMNKKTKTKKKFYTMIITKHNDITTVFKPVIDIDEK